MKAPNKRDNNTGEQAMKIYISGKISGLPLDDARQRFSDAARLLQSLDFDVVNPLSTNVLPDDAPYNDQLAKDIRLLLDCDAIYLMDNWTDSTGAQIEYDVANRMNKYMFFESRRVKVDKDVLNIQSAIHDATGIRFDEYCKKSRKQELCFARMLFAYQCRQRNMKLHVIAKYINSAHPVVLYLLKKYDDDYKYNPKFRDVANRVSEILQNGKTR